MAIYSDNGFGDYGDFGFSVKKSLKKAKKFAKQPIKQNKLGKVLGRVAQASLLPLTYQVQAATWAASKTGFKPAVKLQSKVVKAREYVRTHPLQILAAEAAIIGAAAAAAPAAASASLTGAASAGGGAATVAGSTAAASTAVGAGASVSAGTAATAGSSALAIAKELAAKKAKELAISKAKELAGAKAKEVLTNLTAGSTASPQSLTTMPDPGQSQAPKPKASPAFPLGGAAAGFMVGGPIGAIIGAGAGYFLSKKV